MPRLRKFPFADARRAQREIARLSAELPPMVAEQVELLLETSPSPEQGLHSLAEFQHRHPAVMNRLMDTPGVLRYLIGVFTYSQFLSASLLEHPGWAAQLLDPEDLQRIISHEDLRRRLRRALPSGVPDPIYFAQFRRRQLLRIVVRDIFGLGSLPELTGELTALADVMVETALERIHQSLVRIHGTPRTADGYESHFCVFALGKMGAEELNYSSDIDLMFLYSENGTTDGDRSISNREFFIKLSHQLTTLLSSFTTEGLCYRVDLRLRPDGNQGEICISLEGAKHYYEKRARDWELQMLIKARIAAGHRRTGQTLLTFTSPMTYASSLDFKTIEQLSLTRDRLNEKLSEKASRGKPSVADGIDLKLHQGGIRDIEFLVQCLQRLQGGADPWLQHRATLLALARLHDKGVLSDIDYGRLAAAYQFLRQLEHRLQFDEDRQTHTLPTNPEALTALARKVSAAGNHRWLLEELHKHFQNVSAFYDRVIHLGQTGPAETDEGELQSARLLTTLDLRAPRLAVSVANANLSRGAAAFEHFLERLAESEPALLTTLDADPVLTSAALDVFEHSAFLAEDLIRKPSNVVELTAPLDPLIAEVREAADASQLRRVYRRGILRIEGASLHQSEPIFETLAVHSELTEEVIRTAYRIVLRDAADAGPPASIPHEHLASPSQAPLWILALGRLGMREFDIGSDTDLTFVLADEAAPEREFWTRIAERVIAVVGAYTGEGTLFAVDTRLRPNGAGGPLMQTAGSVIAYFEQQAQPWESLTYLKARLIAGEPRSADAFLQKLQQAYWRLHGDAGRSRHQLREMRAKLERETGDAQPLKSGRGGYYDLDFLLLYLRLKNAGLFFRALNTPERIEVSRSLEALSKADAFFLLDVATFYRSLDHAIRLLTGRSEGRLPNSEAQIDVLSSLLARWSPIPLSDLELVRTTTRALFERYFG